MHALLAGLHLLAVVGLCDVGVGLELLLVPEAPRLFVAQLVVDQRAVGVVERGLVVTVKWTVSICSCCCAGHVVLQSLAVHLLDLTLVVLVGSSLVGEFSVCGAAAALRSSRSWNLWFPSCR